MANKELVSYGEAWYDMKKQSNSMYVKFDERILYVPHYERMSREDATIYYNKKCKDAFNIFEISKKNTIDIFEKRLPMIIIEVRKQTEAMLKREARRILASCLK